MLDGRSGSEVNLSRLSNLVPTARLELAQLSPLPPQDSVSTNSTTTALFFTVCKHEEWRLQTALNFSPKNAPNQGEPALNSIAARLYLAGAGMG
jgi:hypothetical protein